MHLHGVQHSEEVAPPALPCTNAPLYMFCGSGPRSLHRLYHCGVGSAMLPGAELGAAGAGWRGIQQGDLQQRQAVGGGVRLCRW